MVDNLEALDHTILAKGTMAAPADPDLASTIWTAHLTTNHETTLNFPLQSGKLATGLRNLDKALNGGLDYGSVSCISAEANGDADELTLALLVSHLLCAKDATATVVDTTLAFDLRKLHERLVYALQTRGLDAGDAMGALGRLKIMKVFDFVGLTESVTEVRDGLEGRRPYVGTGVENEPAPRGTVGDSEGEEDEMLDSPTPTHKSTTRALELASSEASSRAGLGLLVIDSISHVTAPLLKNSHAQGQALLTLFMRSLRHLTNTHNLCTLLINGTTTYSQSKEGTPSIFSSCTLRPALGKTFTFLLDVHLLVHDVPKAAADAKVLYGGHRSDREAEMETVVEVLQDRTEGRLGRWAAFSVEADGRLRKLV